MGDFFVIDSFIFDPTNLKNMKMQIFKKMMYAIMATVMFISCSKEDNEIEVKQLDPVKDKAIAEAIASSNNKGIPFPEGSKVFKKADGVFTIVLPENMYYLIEGSSNSRGLTKVMEADVYCTCTVGSGCTPLKSEGKYYCIMAQGCSSCDMRIYSNKSLVSLRGIINLNQEVSLINNADKKTYSCMNSEILKIKEVKEGIERFYLKMYNGEIPSFIKENKEIPSKKYVYVKSNVFGHGMVLPVLREVALSSDCKIAEFGGITCECLAGVGCTKKRAFGGVYCDLGNDCDSCGMHDNSRSNL